LQEKIDGKRVLLQKQNGEITGINTLNWSPF